MEAKNDLKKNIDMELKKKNDSKFKKNKDLLTMMDINNANKAYKTDRKNTKPAISRL